MNVADAFDVLAEISGRRVKRAVAVAFIVGVLVFPKPTMGMFNWYVAQRAQDLVQQFEHAISTTTPSTTPGHDPAAPLCHHGSVTSQSRLLSDPSARLETERSRAQIDGYRADGSPIGR